MLPGYDNLDFGFSRVIVHDCGGHVSKCNGFRGWCDERDGEYGVES